jgi:hypothetical protein
VTVGEAAKSGYIATQHFVGIIHLLSYTSINLNYNKREIK